MSDGAPDLLDGVPGRIHHLTAHRRGRTSGRENHEGANIAIVEHFQKQITTLVEQNNQQVASNKALHEKMDRLTNGIERLVGEMNGVRAGRRDEAFARVGSADSPADLPTVKPDSSAVYTLTAGEIGARLKFTPSQIGLLLSARGLNWADNPDFQDVLRHKKPTQQRWWSTEVPSRLTKILNEGDAAAYNITNKNVLAIFRAWRERNEQAHATCSS